MVHQKSFIPTKDVILRALFSHRSSRLLASESPVPPHSTHNVMVCMVECFNNYGHYCNYIRACVTSQSDWETYLSQVLYAYQTAHHSSTGVLPYLLLYGRALQGTTQLYPAVIQAIFCSCQHSTISC